MSTKVLVSDTNIWIDLHRGGLLEAVFSLPYEFVTTDFVWHELRRPPGSDLSVLGLTVLPLSSDDVASLYALMGQLNNPSLADMSCYYLASQRSWVLLTGDGALRKAGIAADMEVRGALWLMDQLYECDQVNCEVLVDSLKKILESGGRLPEKECKARFEKWLERR